MRKPSFLPTFVTYLMFLKGIKQKMKQFFFVIVTSFIILSVFSCKERETEEYVQERVDSFAVHYFNWQYGKCLDYVTSESKKYLQLAATNVTEGNVELLRSAKEDATIDIDDISLADNDNTAIVQLSIHNFLAADTIGRAAKFHDNGSAEIHLIKKDDKWFVDLSQGLVRTAFQQQNEQPNHDQNQD